MSSPQSTTSHEDPSKKNLEQITFRFCAECANMLYPKEDEDSHKLQFTCRTCQYTEEAASTCVFRNILNNAAGETAGVTQDVGSDPTVGASGAFPPADGSLPNVHHPHVCASDADVLHASKLPMLCFCCGGLITCTACGDVYLARPRTANTNTAASTVSDDDADSAATPSTLGFMSPHCNLDDLDDFSLYSTSDNTPEEWFGPKQFGVPDDDFYDFMDETEMGRGNETAGLFT